MPVVIEYVVPLGQDGVIETYRDARLVGAVIASRDSMRVWAVLPDNYEDARVQRHVHVVNTGSDVPQDSTYVTSVYGIDRTAWHVFDGGAVTAPKPDLDRLDVTSAD